MDELDQALKVVAAADQREVLRRGWHLVKRHYYTALNDTEWLEANQDLWRGASVPRDIEWDVEGQMSVAREVGAFVEELRDVPDKEPVDAAGTGVGCHQSASALGRATGAEVQSRDVPVIAPVAPQGERTGGTQQSFHPGPAVFHWHNAFFNTADALVWYGLVRSRRPRRVVEVGCGWSSLLLKRAIERNGPEHPTSVTQIEPYPNERVFAALPKEWTRHRTPVQRVPLEVFDQLGAGDVLFYDGSHCARVASDVNWMVFKVLPRLRAGVLIHFHDLFWPREYPASWIFERRQTWNEQYVLQALLMNSRAYRLVIANGLLSEVRGDEVAALYRGVQKAWGASVWIEKIEEPSGRLEEEARRLEGLCVTVPKAHRDPKPAG